MGVIAQGNSSSCGGRRAGPRSAVHGHINSMAMVNVVVMMWWHCSRHYFAKSFPPIRTFAASRHSPPSRVLSHTLAHSRTISHTLSPNPLFHLHLLSSRIFSFLISFSVPPPSPFHSLYDTYYSLRRRSFSGRRRTDWWIIFREILF